MNDIGQLAVLFTPAALLVMVAENKLRKHQGLSAYDPRQTLNNLGVFVGWRAFVAGFGLAPLWGYLWILEHVSPYPLDVTNYWVWVLGFFAYDLAFWARHWAGHRIGLLWAMHAVHHQSREYNISTATRLSWFSDTVILGVPLALCGIPIEVTGLWFVIGNLWQLAQHTETIGRLGVFDRLLVTPSVHRVHHGCNPQYLDTNYGSMLLIWDQLFGTYVPEEEPVRYGTLSGLVTYDATENNLQPIRALWAKFLSVEGGWLKMQVLWRPPGWRPGQEQELAVMVDDPEPQRVNKISSRVQVASAGLLGFALVGSLLLVANMHLWHPAFRIPFCLFLLFLVAWTGIVLDARPVEPVPMNTRLGRLQARLAAFLFTLAGPYAYGPIYKLGHLVQPISVHESPEGNSSG